MSVNVKRDGRGIEILVKGAQTQEDALAELFERLLDEIRKLPGVVVWGWRIKPETDRKYNPDNWWAYARIEIQ